MRFVKRAQQLGFSLDEIEELLHLAGGGSDACDQTRALVRARIAEVQRRIDELTAMRDALTRLEDTCERPRAQRDCPILRALDADAASADPGR